MGFFRSAFVVARKDISYMIRRRETLLWTFRHAGRIFLLYWHRDPRIRGVRSPERKDPLAIRGGANGGFLVDEIVRRLEAQQYAVMRIEPPIGFAQAVPGTMVMFTGLVLLTSGARHARHRARSRPAATACVGTHFAGRDRVRQMDGADDAGPHRAARTRGRPVAAVHRAVPTTNE